MAHERIYFCTQCRIEGDDVEGEEDEIKSHIDEEHPEKRTVILLGIRSEVDR